MTPISVTDLAPGDTAGTVPVLSHVARAAGHELRNSLNALVVNLEVVRSRSSEPAVQPFLEQSVRQSEESVRLAEQAIAQASAERADIICFPECFVPGYRTAGKRVPPPDAAFLERAWSAIAAAAAAAELAVVLGTERVVNGALLISALVINGDGTVAGFQDKV